MAYLVSIELLFDETDENDLVQSIRAWLSEAKQKDETLLDWSVQSAEKINPSLEDSIANDTYSKGDVFSNWVIYSPSEAKSSDDNAAFWSNDFGWTTFDLATRFDATTYNLPLSIGNDAAFYTNEYASIIASSNSY